MIAAIRAFAGVRAHVAFQQPRAREVFAADGALVLRSTVRRQDVRAERRHDGEDAAT